MIHPPNLQAWKKGDLVLHDTDAKRPEMLMRVIGRTRDGRVKTRYAVPAPINGNRATVWLNEAVLLHDPARFAVI